MFRGCKIVSDDSHFEGSPEMWRGYVDKEFQSYVPKVVELPGGGEGWQMWGNKQPMTLGLNLSSGRGFENLKTRGISYADPGLVGAGDGVQRLKEMDRDRIDAEIIYPPVSGSRTLEGLPDDAYVAVSRGYNDWLSKEFSAADPDRLLGIALIPGSSVQDAVDELKRVKRMPGIRGVVLSMFPNGGPRPLPEDDAFWKAAVETDTPLLAHISFGGGPEQDAPPPGSPTANWVPINKMLTRVSGASAFCCTQLITAGVLDRFPDLRIAFAECGAGWVPCYAEAADSNYRRHHHWAKIDLAHEPSYYIKRHFLFGMQDDRISIKLRDEIGVDNLSWGSDFPHAACDWPHSQALLERLFDGVPDEDVRKIVGGNLSRHLKLDAAAAA